MRLVATNRIDEGAELGRDVLTGRADGIPLLRAGTRISSRYRDALQRAGINAVYIRDALSRGIEPKPAVTDETRAVATRAVAAAFESATDAFRAGLPLRPEVIQSLETVVAQISADIASQGEVALALSDLSAADGYTFQHSINVAALGLLIGERMYRERGYVDWRGRHTWANIDQRLSRLGLGLLVHDIGKLAVPAEVLNKPGELDPAEWELMKTHPLAGVELLKSDLISPLVKVIVRSHHERWDGSGYPDGKSGEDIHEMARIAAVADVYDAVTSERVYAAAKPAYLGVEIVTQGAGTAFDPEVVASFKQVVAPYPPGVEVRLCDGRYAIVVGCPVEQLDAPTVRVTHDEEGWPVTPHDLSLADNPGVWIDPSPRPRPLQDELAGQLRAFSR